MNTLLWVLTIVGLWNLISFIARIYYKEVSYQYTNHIILGFWAAYLLYVTKI